MNNTQDKKKPEEIHNLHYYIDHIRYDITNLIKWLVLAVLTGLSVGFISSLFARVLKFVMKARLPQGYGKQSQQQLMQQVQQMQENMRLKQEIGRAHV